MTKLATVLWFVAAALLLPWLASWLLSFTLIGFAFVLGVGHPVLKRYLILFLPFAVAVFIFHGLVLDRPDFRPIGWLLSYSLMGLDHAALIGGRISLMLVASLLFVSTTHPAVLLRSFDAARWPPGLSFLLASPLLLLDQFTVRAGAIRDAQQARGLALDSGLASRFRAIRFLVVPLVTLALADAHERSGALTARGFRALGHRSVVAPPADSLLEKRLRAGLLTLAVLQLLGALWL